MLRWQLLYGNLDIKLSTSVILSEPMGLVIDLLEVNASSSFPFCSLNNLDLSFSAAASWPPTFRFSSIDNSTESFLASEILSFLIEDTSTITDDVVGEVGRKALVGVRVLERRVIFVFEGLMCFIDVTKLGPSPARCLLWLKINEIDIT